MVPMFSKFLLGSFIFILTIPLYPAHRDHDSLLAEKGFLDFQDREIGEGEILRLDGDWQFFWNRFISPEDPEQGLAAEPEYVHIPGSWHLYTDHPAHGFGTLRLVVSGLDDDSVYSLYMPDLVSSYRLYINGRRKGGNGTVGQTRQQSRPQFLPRIVSFKPQNGRADIVIHVSNYDYRKSGIWRSLYIGRLSGISLFREKRVILEVAIAGILLSIALFHIGIYAYRNQEKAEFLFGLICLTFLIRILCTGEQVLTVFFPSLSWEVLRKLEFIPFYGSASLLALFMSTLFPDESSKMFHRIFVGVCSLYGLTVWLLPVRINNHLIPFAEGLIVIGLIYAVWILARALKKKREEAFLLTAAYAIFSIAVINDILYASQLIQTLYISPMGFVIFMIMQSQMLIRRYSHSFQQREQLALSRDKFHKASITDSLTGLFNVRYLHKTLEEEILRSGENGTSLSLIMADVDNFKHFNDTWGHKQGDEVLKKMGEIIRNSAREHDSPCRYGGEEFSLVLPATTLDEAFEVSERIRFRFEKAEDNDERMRGITVSVGVAQYRTPESADSLIERADKALYNAKHRGKNCVVKAI